MGTRRCVISAGIAVAIPLLAGCNFVFSPDDLVSDPGSTDELSDLPSDFEISPSALWEGAGAEKGKPQPLVVRFDQPIGDAAFALEFPDGSEAICDSECAESPLTCGACSLPTWSPDRRSAALLLRVPVMPSIPEGHSEALVIDVSGTGLSLTGRVAIQGLDELYLRSGGDSVASVTSEALGGVLFSTIVVDRDVELTGTRAARLRATGPVHINASLSVSARGAVPGPGGGAGGGGDVPGVDPARVGVGCSRGVPVAGFSAGCPGFAGGDGGGGGNGEYGRDGQHAGFFDGFSGDGGLAREDGDFAYVGALIGGGGGGGGGGYLDLDAGYGGGGGGGLLLASRTHVSVAPVAKLLAHGGDGTLGQLDDFNGEWAGDGGGGAGGTVIVRAPYIDVAGEISTRGGESREGPHDGAGGRGAKGIVRFDGAGSLGSRDAVRRSGLYFSVLPAVHEGSISAVLVGPTGVELSVTGSGQPAEVSHGPEVGTQRVVFAGQDSAVIELCAELGAMPSGREEARTCASVALLSQ